MSTFLIILSIYLLIGVMYELWDLYNSKLVWKKIEGKVPLYETLKNMFNRKFSIMNAIFWPLDLYIAIEIEIKSKRK